MSPFGRFILSHPYTNSNNSIAKNDLNRAGLPSKFPRSPRPAPPPRPYPDTPSLTRKWQRPLERKHATCSVKCATASHPLPGTQFPKFIPVFQARFHILIFRRLLHPQASTRGPNALSHSPGRSCPIKLFKIKKKKSQKIVK